MSKKLPTESQEQAAVVSWFDLQYPKLSLHLFAVPNGAWLAGSSRQRAALVNKMKKEGMRSGVPDLVLAIPRGGYHGLFIEMKRSKGGTVSEQQKKYMATLNEHGYLATVCRGSGSAIDEIKNYLEGAAE